MSPIVLLILILAVWTDFRKQKISNRLIAFGLFSGLILRILEEGGTGIVHFLVNISIPVILLFLLFQLRILGAGDIKLFSVLGGFLDIYQLIYVMTAAFFIAAVIGAGKILYLKLSSNYNGKKGTLIHFSLAIFLGYIFMVWGGVRLNKISLAICDIDDSYRKRFVTYLVERKADKFMVYAFSDTENFLQALSEQIFDVVILGQGFDVALDAVRNCRIPMLQLIDSEPKFLAEKSAYMEEEKPRCVSLFRYQPMDAILHEVQVLGGVGGTEEELAKRLMQLEVIGVYSPILHEMQMPFSMVLTEKLAESQKILYVNLMRHSGFAEIFGLSGRGDMGDIVIGLRNKRLTKEAFLKCLYESERVYYIPPFYNPQDLWEFSMEDMLELLQFLEKSTDFETVIFDFGEGMERFAEVLQLCQSIYCPTRNGYFYECRMNEFFSYLEKSAAGAVCENIHMINLPFSAKQIRGGGDVKKQLIWSEFGDYVRSCLSGGVV